MCAKKLIKNSQPFGKKFQKTVGGDFFDSHCTFGATLSSWCLLEKEKKISVYAVPQWTPNPKRRPKSLPTAQVSVFYQYFGLAETNSDSRIHCRFVRSNGSSGQQCSQDDHPSRIFTRLYRRTGQTDRQIDRVQCILRTDCAASCAWLSVTRMT